MFKNLHIAALICFLALTSNLVGNLVWTYVGQDEDTIELTSSDEEDSDDSEESNKSSKRSVNLLEEELHLADGVNTSNFNFTIGLLDKTGFSNDIVKPVGQDRIPLENPPEINNVLS